MKRFLKVWGLEITSVVARGLLAAVFVWACIHKIGDPFNFALQVATYQILPLGLVNLQAIILPWIELFAAGLLFFGFWTRPAALVTCGMNIMFIVAIAMALNADLHLQCGCFSSAAAGEEMNGNLIVRDVALLIAGTFLVYKTPDHLTLDYWIKRRRAHGK